MKILGLDVGEKTIGVAVSDALGMTAQGIETIQWRESDFNTATSRFDFLIQEYEISSVVVGLPKNMNGTIGERGKLCQQFAEKFSSHYDLPVSMWDERLSTMQAEKVLLEADMSRAKRKKVIDKMAASMILQSYLEAHR